MAQPSKEQWAEIAEQLDKMHDPVFLQCDGYIVYATLRRVTTNKLAITVAVNGWEFKGEWLPSFGSEKREMSEEARRFWMPKKKAKYSKKNLKLLEKLHGKRACRRRGYYDPYVWPMPVWNRPMPFIRHIKKHNESIEVLDYETYKTEVAKLKESDSE